MRTIAMIRLVTGKLVDHKRQPEPQPVNIPQTDRRNTSVLGEVKSSVAAFRA
ncbi:MAG: hypothetical protein J1E64_02980 [Acetatifactor sp.]|nr:hypothetical protein [Acetatifactor sp.]